MAENGGRFENYYSRAVTHIVCANLPDSKVKHHAHERDPPPTVRPEWVVDSLAAGRLLPVLPDAVSPCVPSVVLGILLTARHLARVPVQCACGMGAGVVSLCLLSHRQNTARTSGSSSLAGEGLRAVAAARQAGPAHFERLCGAAAVALRARARGRPRAPASVEPCSQCQSTAWLGFWARPCACSACWGSRAARPGAWSRRWQRAGASGTP